MAWKAMDIQEQRVRFVVAASRLEKPSKLLSAEFGISRPTGSLWIKRYAEAGVAGISERSRRPRALCIHFASARLGYHRCESWCFDDVEKEHDLVLVNSAPAYS